jgi:hypothetical protein
MTLDIAWEWNFVERFSKISKLDGCDLEFHSSGIRCRVNMYPVAAFPERYCGVVYLMTYRHNPGRRKSSASQLLKSENSYTFEWLCASLDRFIP